MNFLMALKKKKNHIAQNDNITILVSSKNTQIGTYTIRTIKAIQGIKLHSHKYSHLIKKEITITRTSEPMPLFFDRFAYNSGEFNNN